MSLAAEARIIRHQEKKPENRDCRAGLHHHRVIDVRRESRAALLAYGYLRNTPYTSIERTCHTQPDWKRVAKLIDKYGEGGSEGLKDWREA